MEDNTLDKPWQSARYHQAIVPIAGGARKISVIAAGQRRLSSSNEATIQPLVIIEPGLSGVAAEHVVVAQLIASFARVLRYERAGYGDSTFLQQPEAITIAERAHDLSLVLEAIDLPPPYILVGQSYGGTLIREFLQQRGSKDVVGMVLVDAIPLFQGMDELGKVIQSLCGDRYIEIIGLTQNMILTPAQEAERQRAEAIAEENGTVAAEAKVVHQGQAALNEAQGIEMTKTDKGFVTDIRFTRQPLGTGRMSVILGDVPEDIARMVRYAMTHQCGDAATREEAAALLANAKATASKFQEAQTALTAGESRVIKARGTGRTHNLHLTRPDIVAEEVRWVIKGAWESDDEDSFP